MENYKKSAEMVCFSQVLKTSSVSSFFQGFSRVGSNLAGRAREIFETS